MILFQKNIIGEIMRYDKQKLKNIRITCEECGDYIIEQGQEDLFVRTINVKDIGKWEQDML